MHSELRSSPDFLMAMRQLLLDEARRQDQMACEEAAQIPYWAPLPDSVEGHRQCAIALRAVADDFAYDKQAVLLAESSRIANLR
jgi:hypothetical protein